MSITSKAILSDYDKVVALIFLKCIYELPFPLGVRRIISVLKGRHQQFIFEHELHRGSMFGTLAAWKSATLVQFFNCLLEHDLVTMERISVFRNQSTLVLTSQGKAYLAGRLEMPLRFSDEYQQQQVQVFVEDLDLNYEDGRLFEELRQLRYEVSSAKALPPFIVCHDKVLRKLARQRPRTVDQLESINGIGDHFTENYATQFIAVINKFDQSSDATSIGEDDDQLSPYQERLKRIKKRHPRAYEPWSDDEDDRLKQRVEDGYSIREIADFFQRQDGAIRSRISKLGKS